MSEGACHDVLNEGGRFPETKAARAHRCAKLLKRGIPGSSATCLIHGHRAVSQSYLT